MDSSAPAFLAWNVEKGLMLHSELQSREVFEGLREFVLDLQDPYCGLKPGKREARSKAFKSFSHKIGSFQQMSIRSVLFWVLRIIPKDFFRVMEKRCLVTNQKAKRHQPPFVHSNKIAKTLKTQ